MRASLIAVWLVLTTSLAAQAPDTSFEVVSIKPNVSGDRASSSIVQPGGRYVATNMTLRMLMKTAFGVHDDQIVGGPGWIDEERYDVLGKASSDRPTNLFRDEARVMLRAALADRFMLSVRRERREITVYVLAIARDRGVLGSRLRRSTPEECRGPATPFPDAADVADAIADQPCGSGFARAGHLGARAVDFSVLATRLAAFTDRVLVDRTGLTGGFDWDLQWTPEALAVEPSSTTASLSLVTALREQLGLKLDSQRAPVDVLVIDRVEPPEPD